MLVGGQQRLNWSSVVQVWQHSDPSRGVSFGDVRATAEMPNAHDSVLIDAQPVVLTAVGMRRRALRRMMWVGARRKVFDIVAYGNHYFTTLLLCDNTSFTNSQHKGLS